jgi:hypothetical protein
MLTQEQLREVLDYRDGHLYWVLDMCQGRIKAGQRAGCFGGGYWKIKLFQKCYYAHRLVWLWHYGVLPDIIDHINQDKLDNSISNLRIASKQQNAVNTRNKTKPTYGTYFNSKARKYVASIGLGRSHLCLGAFDTLPEAKELYDTTAKEWFGEFYQPV